MIIFYAFVFIFGLLIGSTLNALEYRWQHKKSFAKGRSQCPHCRHVLSAKELIPLVSFAIQQGRCSHCKKKISWQYPLVELGVALSYLGGVYFVLKPTTVASLTPELLGGVLVLMIFIATLWFLLLTDLHTLILPDEGIVVLAASGVMLSLLVLDLPLTQVILGAAIGLGFYGFMYLISSGRWIGFGDVKLALALGLSLGASFFLLVLFVAYIVGGVIAAFLISRKTKKPQDMIAFGPFLIFASYTILIFGSRILAWYVNLL